VNIAVNTRLLLHNKLEGIGWFTFETLKRMVVKHPEHQFYFLFDRSFHPSFIFADNVTPILVYPPARHPILFYLWFEWALPRVLKKHKIDAFLSTDGYLSLRTKVPSVNVIHDLNFEHYPADIQWAPRLHYLHYFPKYAAKASRIATVSKYSKNDIIDKYRVNENKIDVVYNGANEMYQPIAESVKIETRNKLSSGKPYFLYVGALHRRKNISRLLQAFDQFANSNTETILVIVGKQMWHDEEMETTFKSMKHAQRVIFTGRLSVADLHHTLASALALVYIPYFEGFGIPIIEAMQCGTPVITSNCTSMPEVAGDAAVLVNPFDLEDITKAMKTIVTNEELRINLSEKGIKNSQRFSWDKTADALWKCLSQVLPIKSEN
jgi:glycosyltransferase involved in cell wall biosynthesis